LEIDLEFTLGMNNAIWMLMLASSVVVGPQKICTMVSLRIEHKVLDFDAWRSVFENDPINREKIGVKSYRIFRPVDDPDCAIVELDFEHLSEAESTHAMLKKIWPKVEGTIMLGPKVRILNIIETKVY
jgi:hypothetical protein